jgi:hypothetical protein
MGGAYFLHWTLSGTNAATGIPVEIPSESRTWTEPAMGIDAGLLVAVGGDLWIDLGGMYTAFSNGKDRIESAEFWGRKIVKANTGTHVAVYGGIRLVL